MRAAVVIGANAFDFLAATSNEGRKLYASNVALDALLTSLASRGVRRYDFGGVDRTNNKGVFDFKRGAGGTDFTYTGEFETAMPRLAKPVISKLMSLRLSA
jgi:lipid II:glycine glycyltransferase (peptidoglycan interpeptide bridge formation enzyme)